MKKTNQFKVLLVYPNLTMMLVPSIAIALFTGILRKAGFAVGLFDTTHYMSEISSSEENRTEWMQLRPFDHEKELGITLQTDVLGDFVRKVNDFKPNLLVVSVVEDTFIQATKLLDAVKDAEIPNIMGGVFVTAAPEVAISYPQVKMIGIGEGEETVLEVAKRIYNGQNCESVRNVWFKREDGSVVRNGMRPLIDIEKPSPDFSLFDDARFYRPMGGRIFKTLPLETYRGCPYSCTFCNSPMQVRTMRENRLGHFLRRKQMDAIRNDIAFLIEKHDPEYFFIVDDSFLARPEEEIHKFVDMYQEFKIPFWFNTRPENVTEERLDRLKSVNCDRISFGVECGNEEYRRNVIKRRPTNEQIVRSFATISESGIAYSVNNIIGFPDETREMIFETIELARMLKDYDSISVALFTPYHGTELRELAIKKGYLDPNVITTHSTSTSLLKMPQISAEELDGLIKTFNIYVKFPKEEWPKIRLAESDTEEGLKIFTEYQNQYQERFFSGDQDANLKGWDAPQKYAVSVNDDPAKLAKPWGWNCGAEQNEYVAPLRNTDKP